ncbi:GIY-YIG nuclease family protein [Hippea sp. KM1]|uniref:GIY-YIG nuclease family protein n=1 Tax=Hippea sp. KM1 TaxID=944481 RepID=UPI00046D7B5F|nr:GIY-YIG nuclease family protein [Hippea sp. KM1]
MTGQNRKCVDIDRFDNFLSKKGTYVLILHVGVGVSIRIGAIGDIYFESGFYAYVGSALGGLKKRVKRYLSGSFARRWHIDYLLEYADIDGLVVWISPKRLEQPIAKKLSKKLTPIPGFGSSDSACLSHLFYARTKDKLIDAIFRASKAKRMILFEF